MKKRVFLTLMSALMIVGLSACGSANKGQDENSKTETAKSESVVKKSGITESAKTESNALREIGKVSVDNLDITNMQVVDIREEEQYIGWDTVDGKGGHIKGAIDFPKSWLSMDFDKDSAIGTTMESELKRRGLDPEKPTVLYSNKDVSDEEARQYQNLGFKNLSVLEGGYESYVSAGKETDKLAHYEMYVYPQWVQDLIDGKSPATFKGGDYKIFEVSLATPDKEYELGHIPGAYYIKAETTNQVPGPRALADYENIPMEEQLKYWNRPSDSEIQKIVEEAGITKDTTVILYGLTKATTAAARTAAILKYAGVEDIRILNGGETLWLLQGRELEKGSNEAKRVSFGAKVPVNPDVFYDYDEELKVVNDKNSVVASVRSWDEYLCKVSGYTYIGEAGDIANSRFAYAGAGPYSMEDYRNVDNTMFNYNIMAERWKLWGITPDKRVVFHCGTGWRASETYFYAYAMGWNNIHVYDGGWYEWHKHKDSPRKPAGLPDDAPEQKPQEYFIVKDK